MFRLYHSCSLDAFVGWLWYINRSKGFLKVTLLTPFSRAYVERTEKGEPLHLVCFKLESICVFMWSWLEWKFNGRKRIYIFRRSIGRYRSHIGINTFSQQIHSWCGLKRILVIILLPLPVCSHHHRRHHTVAAQHSFLGETMASTNETMFDTPTKKKNGKLLSKVEKKGLHPMLKYHWCLSHLCPLVHWLYPLNRWRIFCHHHLRHCCLLCQRHRC